jgi:uncharacterized protein (DUF1501 family)
MRSDAGKAFDLSQEPASVREAYGTSDFGRGCMLARRLVEAGVPFIEVYLPNWDTHEKRVVDEIKAKMPHLDTAMAALVSDLADRGLLGSTLIVWMGEFGRTPRVNNNGGRDHYSQAWSTVLLGGGIKGGQVIGKTDAQGTRVEDRPVSVKDFMATVCHALGIDPNKRINTPIGRPIRIVENGGNPIREVF